MVNGISIYRQGQRGRGEAGTNYRGLAIWKGAWAPASLALSALFSWSALAEGPEPALGGHVYRSAARITFGNIFLRKINYGT